ncbi:MAG: hypothetical protein EXS16_04885 [Gemmataceae bacterium]|nr:hypothetical protein [Gemmataceae bacterium]
MRLFRSFLVLLCLASPCYAGDKIFKEPPHAAGMGEKITLSFAVTEAIDVEIAVLDGKGRIVRHLAAGVLGGKNPPPAPLQPGLAQKILWDGKDDLGKPAQGGAFQFRLRAGTSVQFGRLIGDSPYTGSVVSMPYRAPVNGLVTDADGNLFVLMMSAVGSHGNSGMWPWHLRKFDRDGNYLRTVLPYPPSTRPDKASGFRLLGVPDQFVPSLYTSLYPVFAVLGNEIVPRLHKGRIAFVHSETRQMNFLTLDGNNQLKTTTMWPAASKLKCPNWLDIQTAFSADGRYAYYANVAGTAYDGKQPGDIDRDWPQGRIYRQDLTQADSVPEKFFDLTLPDWETSKYWMPSAWDKKTASAGIDVDAKGNVLVCDLVNHQVVEISPNGKQLSATPAPWPDRVLVSRKTGDLYVISRKVSRGAVPSGTLTKITGRGKDAKIVAEMSLAGTIGGAYTLDETGKLPVLWLAGNVPLDKKIAEVTVSKLVRIEDRGEQLVVTGDQFLNRDANAIGFVSYMAVDREAELVYVTRSGTLVWRYHGETGKGETLPIKAVDIAIGPGGDIYAWGTGSWEGPIARYGRDAQPKPLEATGKHLFGFLSGRAGRGQSVCGLDVDLNGRVYATFGSNDCHVRVYDEKGKLVDFPRKQKFAIEAGRGDVPAAVTGAVGYGGSVRVDHAGNIYLLQQGVPKDFPVPAGFEKDEGYRNSLGTIYKFPPTGGEVKAVNHTVKEVIGAVAKYAGCGPISRWNAVGSCACTRPRFDVDGFGRLYIPNAITFSVSMRDNADNEIVSFGGYGNYDCQGPKSKEPTPTIPLGWPVTAGVSDRFIYVGDALNHRVVRVDKKYAAAVTVNVAP